MRISDWSSDVCSSDLELDRGGDVTRTLAVIGRAADAPRVQQLAVVGRRGVFEQPLVLGEERPLVADEGLGGAEVDNQVVALDLARSEEHTSELQSLMRISYAVFCLKKKNTILVKYIRYT